MIVKLNDTVIIKNEDCVKELVKLQDVEKVNFYAEEKVNSRIPNILTLSPVMAIMLTNFKTMIASANSDVSQDIINKAIIDAQNKLSSGSNTQWVEVYNKSKGGWIAPDQLPSFARDHLYPELANNGFDVETIIRILCLAAVVILSIMLYESVKKYRNSTTN